jgi:hypothetical protein
MHAEEFDVDELPDVDKATALFYEWLVSDESTEDMSPLDERRVALGLGKKRR